jgi:hypothetical protein
MRSRRSCAGHPGRALDAPDSLSELTVYLGLADADEGGPGHHDEVDARGRRALEPAEALAQQPSGPVPLHRAADPSAHREAQAIESAAVRRGHQQEETTVETCAPFEGGVELPPCPEALPGPEAHASDPCRSRLRRRSASGPSVGGASGRSGPPSSACGPGSRGCASGVGCSAGTSSSSLKPHRPGAGRQCPAGQTVKAKGTRAGLSNGWPSAGGRALYLPPACGTFLASRASHSRGPFHASQTLLFHKC